MPAPFTCGHPAFPEAERSPTLPAPAPAHAGPERTPPSTRGHTGWGRDSPAKARTSDTQAHGRRPRSSRRTPRARRTTPSRRDTLRPMPNASQPEDLLPEPGKKPHPAERPAPCCRSQDEAYRYDRGLTRGCCAPWGRTARDACRGGAGRPHAGSAVAETREIREITPPGIHRARGIHHARSGDPRPCPRTTSDLRHPPRLGRVADPPGNLSYRHFRVQPPRDAWVPQVVAVCAGSNPVGAPFLWGPKSPPPAETLRLS